MVSSHRRSSAGSVKWHYADEGGFTPIAKELPDGALLHIVSDHLGTPKEMFDQRGELVWAADHHVWGAVRSVRAQGALALKPSHEPQPAEIHCPWRFPGQYEDAETGLYYNRHRHYEMITVGRRGLVKSTSLIWRARMVSPLRESRCSAKQRACPTAA